ncbi:1-acyl-sn-glycerol-3-phosphate acyltransferase [Saccharibacter sp. 17.LH.SD]|uniref:lysophospholipid acyltransferase family protein n=1 Tax=Saccharibacter sp. 17.LH.SD TaxID=2689393 RepID=UPI0013703F58|nr:lysophospholipid acyltransferase family protein [Saccharibacter sp. 17.LH.SD]MXV44505.1 1-acyl-sn-glycerol-3-phosphate acyltransferase [Saccharibacter sp. 17.LH.SD]
MSSHPTSSSNSTLSRSNRPSFDPEEQFNSRLPTTPGSLWKNLRSIRRIVGVLLWGAISCIILPILAYTSRPLSKRFPRLFWSMLCWILSVKVRKIGKNAGSYKKRADGKYVIYVANHTSWLDIVVLGKILPTCFLSKEEVQHWPLIGFLSNLAGTVYTTRDPRDANVNIRDMLARMEEGNNIAFFPEGTTSDGRSVMPFVPSLFAIAKPPKNRQNTEEIITPPMLIQPVSIVYDQLEGLPVGRTRRISVFSWFGDMELNPHVWALGKWRSMRASVIFHEPLDPDSFPSRRTLSNAAHEAIRQGCEDLRQNRL